MNVVKSIFKNTSWLMISQILTNILAFIWTILIVRYLGLEHWGVLSAALSYSNLVSMFMDLGISTYITREVSKNSEMAEKFLSNGIPIKIILSIISFIILIIVLNLMGYSKLNIDVTIIVAISIIFNNMGSIFTGIIQAFEKMKFQGISILINSFLLLSGFLIAIYLNLGIIGIAFIYVISSFLTVLYLVKICSSQIVNIKIELNYPFMKEIFKKSIPFGITGMFTTLFFTLDSIMLSIISGNIAVGIYNTAYKLVTVFLTMYSVYIMVFLPFMSKFHKNNKDLLKFSYEKSVKYLLIMILPIAIGISFYSNELVLLLFGSNFIESSNVLTILIWNVVFLFVNGATSTLLNASNREVSVTKINVIGTVFNIVMNLILIPYLSYNGASIATVLTGVLICILMTYTILKLNVKFDKKLILDVLKILLSNIILLAVIWLLKLDMFKIIPIAIIIYLISLYLTKTIDESDKLIIKALQE